MRNACLADRSVLTDTQPASRPRSAFGLIFRGSIEAEANNGPTRVERNEALMNRRISGMLLAPLLVIAACGSSDDSDTAVQAPLLKDVMPMMGALHIYWENKQTDAETVEIERMAGSQAYAPVFSVPASADNKMDDGATDKAATYKYRLRCKKGAVYSGYSNELSGTPN